MIHYVTGLMFSKDMQKVLLIKKLKPDWQYGRFNGLGGKVEENESKKQQLQAQFDLFKQKNAEIISTKKL